MKRMIGLFVPGTRFPGKFIKNPNVHRSTVDSERGGRRVTVVHIQGGGFSTVPGHLLADVPLLGRGIVISGDLRKGWLELRRRETGELVKRNYFCCKRCMRLTGRVASRSNLAPPGREELSMRCTARGCDHKWEIVVPEGSYE